jgi:cytochrome P450
MARTTPEEPLVLGGEFLQDPYAVYARLREAGPARLVLLPTGVSAWLVTRYAEARAVLADPRLHKNARAFREQASNLQPEALPVEAEIVAASLYSHMLNSDPPDHTRLRRLVSRAFTPRRVESLRPRIEAVTDELLEATADAGLDGSPVDLLDSFAFPLPMTVICELLGVPDGDRDAFRGWSATILSDASEADVLAASYAMAEYLRELIASKRARPGDDLLTGLTQARDDDDQLDEEELVSMAFLLLVAGHETTVNLIANGTLALLRNPDQLALLRSDPALVRGAVEEFLRYDGPVNLATARFTSEPVLVGDVEIPAGEFVLVALGSADRDSGRFDRPERLDITRPGAGHLAFGHGIHFCLGAPLARLEGEIAFTKLLARFPVLSLAGSPERLRWRNSSLIRGLERLQVCLC